MGPHLNTSSPNGEIGRLLARVDKIHPKIIFFQILKYIAITISTNK